MEPVTIITMLAVGALTIRFPVAVTAVTCAILGAAAIFG